MLLLRGTGSRDTWAPFLRIRLCCCFCLPATTVGYTSVLTVNILFSSPRRVGVVVFACGDLVSDMVTAAILFPFVLILLSACGRVEGIRGLPSSTLPFFVCFREIGTACGGPLSCLPVYSGAPRQCGIVDNKTTAETNGSGVRLCRNKRPKQTNKQKRRGATSHIGMELS